MSIETLLEAAKFLELQAQQQHKAREDERKEKQRLEQLAEQRHCDVNHNSTLHINNVAKAEERRPVPVPPYVAPPPVSITVIPVVAPNPAGSPALPVAALSPPAAAVLSRSPQTRPDHTTSVLTANHKQLMQNHQHHHQHHHHHQQQQQQHQQHQQLIAQTPNAKLQQQTHQQLVHRYPGSIVSPPQQHALLPQPGPAVQQAPLQNGPVSRGSPPDDGRQLDRKRPGGAGTREVHNKLEKNRRAHLKECFETLKKNIPNIDEKKTSNLSVLRSALRYIQTLKRKEKEYEHDMERLAREKIATQQRLAELKNELSQWMDVIEIDRVLRQTVQPEEDQASTSTASEGEDVMDEDMEDETAPPKAPAALPTVPPTMKPGPHVTAITPQAPTLIPTTASFITQHISIQHKVPLHHPQLQPLAVTPPQPVSKPAAPPSSTCLAPSQPLMPTHTQVVSASSLHPTVIARASVSHPSVIQAVNHVIHGGGPKHIAHLAPSTTTSSSSGGGVHLAPGHQPIGHITVHPVAHLSQHLPALYPQPVAVTQSAVVGHITHTLNHAHAHVNGAATGQPAATVVGKQTAVSTQMVTHHPQLVGQAVLNPVTMVTMPSFPISTLKLA
ncbi:mnt [Pungitius sinensis]